MRWARPSVDVAIVAGSVQLSTDGQVIRVHPIRHDRSRGLGAFATAKGRSRRKTAIQLIMSARNRSADVGLVPEIDTSVEHGLIRPVRRPMSAASPRRLHVGNVPFRACGRPAMR
jgi:hypothetical protein